MIKLFAESVKILRRDLPKIWLELKSGVKDYLESFLPVLLFKALYVFALYAYLSYVTMFLFILVETLKDKPDMSDVIFRFVFSPFILIYEIFHYLYTNW